MAELADNGLNRRISEQDEVLKECEAIEADIAALRAAYEQYFVGAERHPPTDQHSALKKRFQKLKGTFVRQTALKFRVQSVQGKLATYERLWSRTLREIEDGTYKRDVFKAKLRAQKEAAKKEPKSAAAHDVVEELDTDDLLEELPLAAAVAKASSPGMPAVAPLGAAPPVKTNPTGVPAITPIAAPSSSGMPAVKPVSGSIPAVAPVKTNPTGVPAVPPVATPSSSGMPAVKPVSGSIPAVAPVKSNPLGAPAAKSSPGMPAVPPVKSNPLGAPAAKSSPGMPAVKPPSSPGLPRVTPQASSSNDVSDAKLKAVYEAYVTAKKRCQEDVSKISYEQVAANLRKQVPELMKKHNASGVEFKVVIKDGKAVLKAVPK